MRILHVFFLVLVSFALLTFFSGCAQNGASGKWVTSSNVERLFETKTVLPDHTYYYRGNERTPESIIAIDNTYTLQTKVWTRVAISQKILDGWIYWINTRTNLTCPYRGGTILTPDGQKAGIWYSRKLITTVKVPESGVIQVYPPFSIQGSECARQERLDDL